MYSSRIALTIITCLICTLLTFSCKENRNTQNTIKEKVVERITNGFSVGTAVVFFHDGKEEYFNYGFSDTTHRQPITKKSVFEIGSISKTFTTLLLADLILKGKVKANDPIEIYLPDSLKIPSYKGSKITFEDLATHTSGLPRMPKPINPVYEANPFADYTSKKMYDFLGNYKLTRARGKFEYSNLGVGLLGDMEEKIYGKTYEQLLQSVICKPLGMPETSTLNTSPYLTTAHDGTMAVSHTDLASLTGAGGIRSSSGDMLRYLKFQMGLLPSSLLPAMKLTQHPLHNSDGNMKIGLGWHIIPLVKDTVIWHSGGTAGYRTFIGFSLKSNKAIVILNNSAKSVDDLGMFYFDQNKPIEAVKKPTAIPLEQLKDKVGVYKVTSKNEYLKPDSEIRIKLEKGQLVGRLASGPWVKLLPESESQFFTHMDHAVNFIRNTEGRIQTIEVRSPFGQVISATRLNSTFPLLR